MWEAACSPPGPGRRPAPTGCDRRSALAWRLHVRALLAWAAGFAVVGLVLGGAADSVDQQFGSNQRLTDLLARLGGSGGLTDAFLAASFAIMAVRCCGLHRLGDVAAARRGDRAARPSRCSRPASVGCSGRRAISSSRSAVRPWWWSSPGCPRAWPWRRRPATPARCHGSWGLRWPSCPLSGCSPEWPLPCSGCCRAGRLRPGRVLAACLLLGQIGETLDLDPRLLDVSPFTHVPKLPGAGVHGGPADRAVAVAAALTPPG